MNWKEIEEIYPKAWDKLCQFHNEDENSGFIDHPAVWGMGGLEMDKWEFRHLYDFFDNNNIFIAVYPLFDVDLGSFCWDITNIDVCVNGTDPLIKNRTMAEEQAFERAFELLEEIS